MRDSKIFDNVHQHHSITSEILNACAGAGAENVNPVFLLHGHRGSGKTSVSSKVAAELGASFTVVNSYQLWSESSGSAEEKITGFFEQCMSTNKRRAVVVIRHFDLVGRDANSGQTSGRTIQHLFDEVSRMAVRCNTNSVDGDNSDHSQLIVFATTDDLYSVDGNVIDKFDMVYELEVPLAAVRKLILERQECVYGINEDAEFIASVVKKTPGYLPSDLKNLLFNSLTDTRACEAIESRKITETGCIFNCDCSQYPQLSSYKPNDHEPCREVLHRAVFERIENDAKIHARMSGAPEVPTTSWKDVGGLEAAKSKVRHAIRAQAELRDAEDALTVDAPSRSGVLLCGPPGCGKTLLAKAAAGEVSASFLSVKGPELLNMYVGQSEANVRTVFAKARSLAPCILFFDELDSLAPNRGRTGDSGGVMDRIVSQLLAELDDVNTGESSCDVFVMGATNRPDLIDPSLLRPGRFERPVYVGIRGDQTARMSVLRACTRKLDIEPGVDWKKVLDSCHANLTGADFSQVAANAMMLVIERVISTTSAHEQETVDLLVTQKDLVEAATGVRPSVGEAELSDYEKLGD